MKTSNLLLSILLLAGLFVSCKKDLFDYRNKYTDDYSFTGTTRSWSSSDTNVFIGSFNNAGKIEKGDSDNTLFIFLDQGSIPTLTVQVDSEGNLFYPCASMSAGVIIGTVDGDNMTLEYETIACCFCMGQGTVYTIAGQKD